MLWAKPCPALSPARSKTGFLPGTLIPSLGVAGAVTGHFVLGRGHKFPGVVFCQPRPPDVISFNFPVQPGFASGSD